MSHQTPVIVPVSLRAARCIRGGIVRLDPRLLVALVSCAGIAAWLLPWQGALVAGLFAGAIMATACVLLREARAALAAYAAFILFWALSQAFFVLWQHTGTVGEALPRAVALGGLMGVRLFALLGFALAVPLAATPLTLGRVLAWYLSFPAAVERHVLARIPGAPKRALLTEAAWRASLALALMMAFFPRTVRLMAELRRTVSLRAPRMGLIKRLTCLGAALLRILSVQAWDMTLAVASRDLYRPEPWQWRTGRATPPAL